MTKQMVITDYIGEFISVGAAITTGVLAYQKGRADVKGSEMDNVTKAVGVWRELSEKLETDLDKIKRQGDDCEKARVHLSEQVAALMADSERNKKHIAALSEAVMKGQG